MARRLLPRSCTWALLLTALSCSRPDPEAPPPSSEVDGHSEAVPAVLHRLTEKQINHALRDLFLVSKLDRLRLPRDIPVNGFENNALTRDATPFLVESLQRGVQDLVAAQLESPGKWLHCSRDGGDDPRGCGHATLRQFAPRAFRRPLAAEEEAWLLERFDAWLAAHDFRTAIQLAVQTVLLSPDFLYLVEVGDTARARDGRVPLTGWELASRLSFLLWNSMPDAELFAAAAQGRLDTRADVRREARRLMQDPRAEAAIVEFHRQWLAFDEIERITVDPDVYFPELDDEEEVGGIMTQYRLSLTVEFKRFIASTILGPQGTVQDLLTSRDAWVSRTTAEVYGASYDSSQGEVFRGRIGGIDEYEIVMYPGQLPEGERAGVLTSAAFLASHAHPGFPSPVLRGVFIRDRLLCAPPPAPPDDVPPIEETENEEPQTNRDRYEAHVANPACAGCHVAIDGVGFPFEHYDSVGAYRTQDNGHPVDASGELVGTDVDGPVSGAVDLAERLAVSRTVHDCVVKQWWRFANHRNEEPEDDAALDRLADSFWHSGGVVPELLVDLVSDDTFRTRLENHQ
ncbi:MAG: DUF1592 domain-containing protein [Myxococcales bacterium FL481]|nr:MAG: DUF1592 domain-containing protein [Myxococcales bacterium FL481]